MRKCFIVLVILLVLFVGYYIFFPKIYNNRVNDYANIYSKKEEEEILEFINVFIKSSGIDFKYATVDDLEDYRNLISEAENDIFWGKGIHKSGILVVFVKENYKLYTTKYGKAFSSRDSFKYGIYNFYKMSADKNSIKYVINSLAGYFVEKALKILIIIIILTAIFAELLLKKLRSKYSILQIDDAKSYYNPNEIKFL